MNYKQEFLDLLLEKNALKIAPDARSFFKLKSGRMSPTFISIGALTDGKSLSVLKKVYSHAAMDGLRSGVLKDFRYVFGPAYKGITLAALTSEGLYEEFGKNTFSLYDRKEEKAHGEATQGGDAARVIVGAEHFTQGGALLLVDDVVTTGQAKYEALGKIKLLGKYETAGMVVAVDRQELLGDAQDVGSRSAVQTLEEDLGLRTVAILTMRDIFSLMRGALDAAVRRAWVGYYERYGAVRME